MKRGRMSDQTTTDETTTSEAALRSQAYNAAMRRLRAANMDQFLVLVTEEATKRGVVYTPRKTAKEKAAEKMRALLEEFPDLAGDLGNA